MPNTPASLPWGTYILTVIDREGTVVHTDTYTGQSGTSMMDAAKMERAHWDRINTAGAPHTVDW